MRMRKFRELAALSLWIALALVSLSWPVIAAANPTIRQYSKPVRSGGHGNQVPPTLQPPPP